MTSDGLGSGATAEAGNVWRRPDARRSLQLALAAIWLLDGILQLQPFMFTAGSKGFSGMLSGTAAGNPGWISRSIAWNASVIDHHAVATDAAFAFIQIAIGFGIAWRRTTKPALAASIIWALAVWWFGEGLGGVAHGTATPIGGGPGAVLFYALLAVLLWPTERTEQRMPFVAAGVGGEDTARAVWLVVWVGLALLFLVGAGRSPQGTHNIIQNLNSGQPGWLSAIDRHAESLVAHEGMMVATVFAAACLVVAAGVFLPVAARRATLVLAMLMAALIWVVGENFGGILVGGATDPNSGPLVVLLALAYWPLSPRLAESHSTASIRAALPATAEAT